MIQCKTCGKYYSEEDTFCPCCFSLTEKGRKEIAVEKTAEETGTGVLSVGPLEIPETKNEEYAAVMSAAVSEHTGRQFAECAPKVQENMLPDDEEPLTYVGKHETEHADTGKRSLLVPILISVACALLLCISVFAFLIRAKLISFSLNGEDRSEQAEQNAGEPALPEESNDSAAPVENPMEDAAPDDPAAEEEQDETTASGEAASEEVKCSGLTIPDAELKLKEGETTAIDYTVQPADCTEKARFTVVNPNIAGVDDEGTVTAYKEGSTQILITCGSYGTTCTITVISDTKPILPELNQTDITLRSPGDSYQLVISGAEDVVWESDNEKIVVVEEDGTVTGIGTGTANVTGTVDGISYTCIVRCPFGGVEGETVNASLNHTDVTLAYAGEYFTLKVKYIVEPDDPIRPSWSSSDPDKCSVDESGVVTALKAWNGNVEITTVIDGVKLTCVVRCGFKEE